MLVVGGGNTGFQIAEELSGTHEVHLSIGGRQPALPQRLLGRDIFTVLSALGAMDKTVDSRLGRRMRDRDTLMGPAPRAARRQGITLHGRPSPAPAGTWASPTGRSSRWPPSSGRPASTSTTRSSGCPSSTTPGASCTGAASRLPGLYFLGLPWLHTRGSALLGWVEADARHIADRIAECRPATGMAAATGSRKRSRSGLPVWG